MKCEFQSNGNTEYGVRLHTQYLTAGEAGEISYHPHLQRKKQKELLMHIRLKNTAVDERSS